MPKTEAELRNWVIERNRHATHDRGLFSNYGYHAILDVDLLAVCRRLRAQFAPPIRVLDVGCGDGWALKQLAEHVERAGLDPGDFEFWGMGMNRYEQMWIPPERFIHSGLYAFRPDGMQVHLIFSVFTFHYLWHKLEAVEKIHNQLLEDGGHAYLHFPGYLVRFGESLPALTQGELDGNQQFARFLEQRETDDPDVVPLRYQLVPQVSDDDDRTPLAEFGHLRFRKTRTTPLCLGHSLEAFALFESGFAYSRMNDSQRIYVASHYQTRGQAAARSPVSVANVWSPPALLAETNGHGRLKRWVSPVTPTTPYRIACLTIRGQHQPLDLHVALHSQRSDSIVVVCPGACEPLAGRVVEYTTLSAGILQAGLGAVVRYNDPYDHQGDYAELLLEKLRRVLDFTLDCAHHLCLTARPRLHVMAYSSSAAAAACLASQYEMIYSLLLIAPSFDVPRERVLPSYQQFRGRVHVLIGDSDQVVLPQQAFWYYEQARQAAYREYAEVPCCGHTFEAHNKVIFLEAPQWAFGSQRPMDFPPACCCPSSAWR